MLERTARIVSENLARNLDRRLFLRRTGEALFAGVVALVVDGKFPSPSVVAASSPKLRPLCTSPGPWCNLNGINEPNGCHGSSCYQHLSGGQVLQCRLWYDMYQFGCWTTSDPNIGGYWTCCDCECGTPRRAACGCAVHSSQPVPRPDGPQA